MFHNWHTCAAYDIVLYRQSGVSSIKPFDVRASTNMVMITFVQNIVAKYMESTFMHEPIDGNLFVFYW